MYLCGEITSRGRRVGELGEWGNWEKDGGIGRMGELGELGNWGNWEIGGRIWEIGRRMGEWGDWFVIDGWLMVDEEISYHVHLSTHETLQIKQMSEVRNE